MIVFRLRVKFDPLCAHLEEAYDRKKILLETLDRCVTDEKKVTSEKPLKCDSIDNAALVYALLTPF